MNIGNPATDRYGAVSDVGNYVPFRSHSFTGWKMPAPVARTLSPELLERPGAFVQKPPP